MSKLEVLEREIKGLSASELAQVRMWLDELEAECSPLEATNAVIRSLENSEVVFDYYTRERLWSEEARRVWVEPDLKALMARVSAE